MGKWFFTVESNCIDNSREDEFNDWYDHIDLPDVLETTGFKKATRYKCVSDLNEKYERQKQINRSDQSNIKAAFQRIKLTIQLIFFLI